MGTYLTKDIASDEYSISIRVSVTAASPTSVGARAIIVSGSELHGEAIGINVPAKTDNLRRNELNEMIRTAKKKFLSDMRERRNNPELDIHALDDTDLGSLISSVFNALPSGSLSLCELRAKIKKHVPSIPYLLIP
jgi:hypothetical protein